MSEELSLEKLNADRITKLEEKIERRFEVYDNKLDRIISMVSRKEDIGSHSKSNGNGYVSKSVSVVFGILLPILGLLSIMYGMGLSSIRDNSTTSINALERRLESHASLEAHPQALQLNAKQDATLLAMQERVSSIDARVENFKQERARINELEKDMGKLMSRTEFIPQIMSWQSEHDEKVASINSAQDARLNGIEKLLEEKSRDRFTGAEGEIIKERLSIVEAEQRRRSTAQNWAE